MRGGMCMVDSDLEAGGESERRYVAVTERLSERRYVHG